MQHTITDDLDVLLATLPPRLADAVKRLERADLIEIIMDLGRLPEARFPTGEVILDQTPITDEDIEYVIARIGNFGDDNRAGIERTLHRISAIRNRRGKVVGLTCRVGRAVYGTVALIRDVVEQGRSLLILGRPGVGKTTMLREVARVLADDLGKRVVIVDTSNEIAGDGDVPHPGIGRARRMQVARPAEQHAVMIEAVENHMPEVIIIDEIGTELEAHAARTIAERGVQLVGTAHGNTLDNLLLNPTLSDLVGGISSVTLGDEEARRRGTQKTVLERKAPPTFDVVVEQQDRAHILVHPDVAQAVDALLRGETPTGETRALEDGRVLKAFVSVASQRPELAAQAPGSHGGRGRGRLEQRPNTHSIHTIRADLPPVVPVGRLVALPETPDESAIAPSMPLVKPRNEDAILRIYPFGVSQDRIAEAAHTFAVPVRIAEQPEEADVILTHRNIYRRQNERLRAAESANVPILVLKNPGIRHVREAFGHMLGIPATIIPDEQSYAPVAAGGETQAYRPIAGSHQGAEVRPAFAPRRDGGQREAHLTAKALQEAEDAIHHVLHGRGVAHGVELSPQDARIRRMQHLLAERYNVRSRSYGKEPNRRVCILPS